MAEEVLVPKNETTQHHVTEHCKHEMITRILNVSYAFMCSFATLSEDCIRNCAASLRLLSGFFLNLMSRFYIKQFMLPIF